MQSEDNNKKIKFILAWYNSEKYKYTTEQKLILLNKWITSCSQYEEYEMAKALLVEKIIVIKEIRLRKIGKRTFFKKVKLLIRFTIRKHKRR